MNFLPVTLDSLEENKAKVTLSNDTILDFTYGGEKLEKGQPLTLGLRPDMLKISPEGKIRGQVALVERLGNETLMYITIDSLAEPLTVSRFGQYNVSAGDEVKLTVDDLRAHFFGEDEKRINRRVAIPSSRLLAPSGRF